VKNVSLLIADDDPQILTALRIFLTPEGYQLTCCRTPAEAVLCLQQHDYDAALIDLNYHEDTTSGQEGISLLQQLKACDEHLPVIVMTGFGSVGLAVAAMKLGAADFIEKPWDNERLLTVLRSQIELKQQKAQSQLLAAQNQLLQQQITPRPGGIIAQSDRMQQLIAQLEKLAQSDMNVLLTGENGTGKSMLAEYLHQCSARRSHSFVAVNMGAISENLFESEMFGHVKGAFTDAKTHRVGRFELAQGGTLFLDEIANIPLSQQAKLLRVLEQHQYEKLGSSKTQQADVRIVSATNAALADLVQQGSFRQDLWYRLNTVEIVVPPLRARGADIVPLAQSFLRAHAVKYRVPVPQLSAEAIAALQQYSWPGNIRELSHVIERALFLSQQQCIEVADLNLPQRQGTEAVIDFQELTLDDIEKQVLQQRMQRYQQKPQETAQSLGLSRSAYYRRLEKFGL
jgi:DNA-binding NtrC family response regulator